MDIEKSNRNNEEYLSDIVAKQQPQNDKKEIIFNKLWRLIKQKIYIVFLEIQNIKYFFEYHQQERRINKYEREITYLSQKNETMSSQLKVLQKERVTYDDSVKDMKKELVEKKQLCEQLDQKLNLSLQNASNLQEMYAKMIKDQLNNQKVEEMQRQSIQVEKYKEQIEIQKDEILRAEKEKENLQESVNILQSQIQSLRQTEESKIGINTSIFQSNISTSSTLDSTYQQKLPGNNLVQGLETNTQISSYTLQIATLKNQLELIIKESEENKRNQQEYKNSMSEQLLKVQNKVTERETTILEKQGEIESLKDQIKTFKEQIEQNYTDKHDLKQNYEDALNKNKTEILALQTEKERKDKIITQLQEQLSQIGQKNMILEENLIPTEEDSIREITFKYNTLQKEYNIVTEKNRQFQAQLDYLQRDLKQKLPILSLRKNEYQTMHTNYQSLKEKLALSIKNSNQLQNEKTILLEEIQKLSDVKVKSNKRIQSIEQDNLYLNFLLIKFKKTVVEKNSLDGVNLVHFNLEYLKQTGITEEDKSEYLQLCQQYNEQNQSKEEQEIQNENIPNQNIIKSDDFNRIQLKQQQQEEECKQLKKEISEYKDKIDKLEQMDTIRFKILGEANSTISLFNQTIQSNELLEKERQKLSKIEEERDYFKKEYNKTQFELSRYKTEQEIIKEMIQQVEQQANLYSSKYEKILKSQLKENTAFEQSRADSKKLKLQLLELNVKNESLSNQNTRLNSQIEFLRKQIKQETENYMDALKKKKLYLDRDQKSSVELKNLRQRVQELSQVVNELREKNQLEVEVVQQKLNEQLISSQQSQVHYNIIIENFKLLSQHTTSKLQSLNKIIQDQEKEIRQLKSKQHMLQMDENGEQIDMKDIIVDENFVRLDTQFLKNLNRMELIVQEQKEEHQKTMQNMQNTLQELAEKCILLSDKLKQAEKIDDENVKKIKSLEEQHLMNLNKNEKEFQEILQQKQTQMSELEKRFEEYRQEQSKKQQGIIKKMSEEQQMLSNNDELKRLADEKEELNQQLKEIKEYLAEIASEKLILEAANQNEMEFYINQLNKNQQQLQKIQDGGPSSKMDIEEPNQQIASTDQNVSETSDQSLLKQINDSDFIFKQEQKIKELQQSQDSLLQENQNLSEVKQILEQKLEIIENKLNEKEKEIPQTDQISELKKNQVKEMQEQSDIYKSEKQLLLKQIEHLSQFNKQISSEDALKINELTQKEDFLELMEKLQKYFELKSNKNKKSDE